MEFQLPHVNELWILAAWYVFSAAVGSMPMPEAADPKWYKWLFGFLNTLAANISRAKVGVNGNQPQPK